jgi:hypothetical protein
MFDSDTEQNGKIMVALGPAAVFEIRHCTILADTGGTFREWIQDNDWNVEDVFGPFVGRVRMPEDPGLWVFDGWCDLDNDGQWTKWKGAWRRPTVLEVENIANGLDPFLSK